MGFLDAIFHAAAISMVEAQREVRQDKQRERDLYDRCLMAEVSLNDFLKRTGCPSSYLSDSQNCEFEISKMKDLKRKYEEYLSLGGDPRKVGCIEDIDEIVIELKQLQRQSDNSNARKPNQLTVTQRNILKYLSDDVLYDHDTRSPRALAEALKEGGFCPSDINWALEHADIDWSEKAEEAVFSYLKDDEGIFKEQLKRVLKLEEFSDALIQKVVESPKIDWCSQALKIANDDAKWSNQSEYSTTPEELKKKLIDDNNFSEEDAQYAVKHCCMDWQAEAAKRAHELQGYAICIDDFTKDSLEKDLTDDGFSDNIIQLIVSSNQIINWNSCATETANRWIEISQKGNYTTTPKELKELLVDKKHYTEEEAQYAIANCSADWNQEVINCAYEAKKWELSTNEIKSELLEDGFTDSQVEYALANLKWTE